MLLAIDGEAAPADSGTHIVHRFSLNGPAGKLTIRFAYAPKRLEDNERARGLIMASIGLYTAEEQKKIVSGNWEKFLPLNNLITLSVDDPEGYRGAAHRQDPEQLLVLSEREASPGLMKGELAAGIWSITLSLHAIVTERCSYKLEVWTSEEGIECAG